MKDFKPGFYDKLFWLVVMPILAGGSVLIIVILQSVG